jgi:hypothetical protein
VGGTYLYLLFFSFFEKKLNFNQNLPQRELVFVVVTKLTSVTVFLFFDQNLPQWQLFVFVSLIKFTSPTVFCQKCFRLRQADYRTIKNYWSQSQLFLVIKLKKRKKQYQGVKFKPSHSGCTKTFLR